MVKKKISTEQEIYSKEKRPKINRARFKKFDPTEYILDKKNFFGALAECLEKGDIAGILEVVQIYLEALPGTQQHNAGVESNISENSNQGKSSPGNLIAKIASGRQSGSKKHFN